MKIAFLITAHTDPKQLRRLILSLHNIGDFYVHINRVGFGVCLLLRGATVAIFENTVHFSYREKQLRIIYYKMMTRPQRCICMGLHA